MMCLMISFLLHSTFNETLKTIKPSRSRLIWWAPISCPITCPRRTLTLPRPLNIGQQTSMTSHREVAHMAAVECDCRGWSVCGGWGELGMSVRIDGASQGMGKCGGVTGHVCWTQRKVNQLATPSRCILLPVQKAQTAIGLRTACFPKLKMGICFFPKLHFVLLLAKILKRRVLP